MLVLASAAWLLVSPASELPPFAPAPASPAPVPAASPTPVPAASPTPVPAPSAAAAIAPPPVPAASPSPASPPVPAASPDPAAERFYPPAREHLRLAPGVVGDGPLRFKPGEGLEIRSKDGRYALTIGVRTAFLYAAHRTPKIAFEHAFEVRRVRLLLSGNVFSPHIKYYVQLALGPRETRLEDGQLRAPPLFDAYLRFDRLRDLTVQVGQFRPGYSRERNQSAFSQLFVDRSLANAEFNLDRDIGVELRSADIGGLGRLRYYAGVYSGDGRDQNRFGDAGLLYTARLEVLPFGLFDDYEASDQPRLRRPRLALGAAYAYNDRARYDRSTLGAVPADGGTTDYHHATVDLVFRVAGFAVDAAYLWRDGRRAGGGGLDVDGAPIPVQPARTGHGWMAQASFLIPRTGLEPAARFSAIRGHGVTATPDRNEAGGGLNYYFAGHRLKLQLDYFRTWDPGKAASESDLVRLLLQLVL